MSAAEPSEVVVPLTRRERQRQATFDEIIEVARRLLRETKTVSLRAVAQEMGMTPPALYRYVDGYDELIVQVAQAIFLDVVETMRATVSRYDDGDPGAQLVTAVTAFRRWALANPDEFEIIFASQETAGYKEQAAKVGGYEFSSMFSEIFLRVYRHYQFDLSEADSLPSELIEGLEQARAEGALPCELPDEPIGLVWVFMRCWARVYGTVTLEVFGHIDQAMIDSGVMFAAMMDDNGRELNLGTDFDRLRALIRTEMASS
jgi:AcrR family transcriptional regulator